MRRRFLDDLGPGFVAYAAYGLAALVIAIWFAPRGPLPPWPWLP
jgi:hypothetical protein